MPLPDITAAFPRWTLGANIKSLNDASPNPTFTFIVAGDSRLENNYGIAPGFPERVVDKDEAIIDARLLEMIGSKAGD